MSQQAVLLEKEWTLEEWLSLLFCHAERQRSISE